MSVSKTVLLSEATLKQWKVFRRAEQTAENLGHLLHREWQGNRWGYHTTCKKCGAFAGVKVSKGILHGSAFDSEFGYCSLVR